MSIPSFSRLLPSAVLLFAGGLCPSPVFAADAPPTHGNVVELPKLTVNERADLPELESWRTTRITNFAVLSNASDRTTRQVLADFQKFQQAVQLVWPAPAKPLAAYSLLLCGRDNKFDAFIPTTQVSENSPVPSLFLRNREQIAIIVDLEAQRITINDSVTALAQNAAGTEYEVDRSRA